MKPSLLSLFLNDQRLRGTIRLFFFFAFMSIVGTLFLARTARAKAEGQMRDIGRQLLENLGPAVVGEPQQIQINGQRVFVAANATALAPQEVIDRVEHYCRQNSGGLSEAVGQLPKTLQGRELPQELRDPSGWMMERSDRRDEDFQQITCFARSDQGTLSAYFERFGTFFETGDVTALGDMRYAVARALRPGTTQALVIWTEGHFNLFDMFPEEGDAPGGDPIEAPRPRKAKRLLSADIPGNSNSFHIYESSENAERVLAYYDSEMHTRGYATEPVWAESANDQHTTATPSYARAFMKNGHLFIVTALREPAFEKGTQVSLVKIGGGRVEAHITE